MVTPTPPPGRSDPIPPANPSPVPGKTYVVRRGDTLGSIAKSFGVDVASLAVLNGLRNNSPLFQGQPLRLPAGAARTHVIERGETMSGIAQALGVSLSALIAANPQVRNPNHLYPGDRLRVPAGAPEPKPAPSPKPTPAPAPQAPAGDPVPPAPGGGGDAHRLGSLSETYESGNRGPGTVSGGQDDPGGVSYGIYQLASRTPTLQSFLTTEGQPWAREFAGHQPGTRSFSERWQAIALREPAAFRDAQHAFIERTHYTPAVTSVRQGTGLDLDTRHNAVRDATWSVSVQHRAAASILSDAVTRTDRQLARTDPGYDRALITNIYARRTEYVRSVANTLPAGQRNNLIRITQVRYPAELRDALAMLQVPSPVPPSPSPAPGGPNPNWPNPNGPNR